MDDYEYDDTLCPKCGHEPTHWQRCTAIGCDDGHVDMHEFDDPMMFDEGDMEACQECRGTGHHHWCPACGYDFNDALPLPEPFNIYDDPEYDEAWE